MNNKGFTLLEILVSVAIMGLIMTLVWTTTSQTLNSKERVEKRDMVYQYARVALQKISDDLSMAFLVKKPSMQTAIMPRPITFFIGEDSGEQDSLGFTSFSHLRLFQGARESDQCQIKYEVIASKDETNVMNLVRREVAWLDDNTEVIGAPLILSENIEAFELEYYDDRKDEWVDSWDSEKIDYSNQLPKAVKISISFPDPDDEEEEITLRTIVLLPMYVGAIDF